jgi:hypothetical protein
VHVQQLGGGERGDTEVLGGGGEVKRGM